jgi:hypothetical protein
MKVITRQHEDTTIPELYGLICTGFLAAYDPKKDRYGPFYIQLAEVWHRFFLDAGLLFWKEGFSPDTKDDLLESEIYRNIASEKRLVGSEILAIEMTGCQLVIRFGTGASLVFRNEVTDVGATLVGCIESE